tara:strand:- start:87 stop:848 length:762 start_codon:yes stop_codon:yes gene_type:complete
MTKLTIKNLHANVNDTPILNGVDLTVEQGEVHVLMGLNGSGKSTLANVLMGNPKYTVTQGDIYLDEENITKLAPDERAKKGLFMSFQYPAEITGVTLSNFLRTARNAVKKDTMNVIDFHALIKKKMEELNIDPSFRKRYINEGFSGGEKKRAEILQMSILEPTFAILDECDSGLDIDSIKIVGEGIKSMHTKDRGILIITHYSRILKYITPDRVSIMVDGKIVKTGGQELAHEIEEKGFDAYMNKEKIEVSAK